MAAAMSFNSVKSSSDFISPSRSQLMSKLSPCFAIPARVNLRNRPATP